MQMIEYDEKEKSEIKYTRYTNFFIRTSCACNITQIKLKAIFVQSDSE